MHRSNNTFGPSKGRRPWLCSTIKLAAEIDTSDGQSPSRSLPYVRVFNITRRCRPWRDRFGLLLARVKEVCGSGRSAPSLVSFCLAGSHSLPLCLLGLWSGGFCWRVLDHHQARNPPSPVGHICHNLVRAPQLKLCAVPHPSHTDMALPQPGPA